MSDYVIEVLYRLSLMLPAFLCGLTIGLNKKEADMRGAKKDD